MVHSIYLNYQNFYPSTKHTHVTKGKRKSKRERAKQNYFISNFKIKKG